MDFGFKEISTQKFFFKNPYKGTQKREMQYANDIFTPGFSINFGERNPNFKLLLLLVRLDYKMQHDKTPILDYVCDVIYFLSYDKMDNAHKSLDDLLTDTHTRASNEFKRNQAGMTNQKMDVRLPDITLQQRNDLRTSILKQIFEQG
jgi:hypothetical protein